MIARLLHLPRDFGITFLVGLHQLQFAQPCKYHERAQDEREKDKNTPCSIRLGIASHVW